MNIKFIAISGSVIAILAGSLSIPVSTAGAPCVNINVTPCGGVAISYDYDATDPNMTFDKWGATGYGGGPGIGTATMTLEFSGLYWKSDGNPTTSVCQYDPFGSCSPDALSVTTVHSIGTFRYTTCATATMTVAGVIGTGSGSSDSTEGGDTVVATDGPYCSS